MKTQMNNSFSDALSCSTDGTEEEQDDLLCDGDVEITHKYNNNLYHLNDCICAKDISGILNLTFSEDNKYTTANYAAHPQLEEFSSGHRGTKGTTGVPVELPGSEASFKKEFPVGSSSKPDSKEHLTASKMSSVLLRHFSEEELLSTCQFIECETIPETSFTDSIDDSGSKAEPSEHLPGPSGQEQGAPTFEEHRSDKHREVNSSGENENVLSENRPASKKPISCTGNCGCRQENSQLVNENEHTHTFQNMKDERGLSKKIVSPCKLQYGQGQARCCLPDFYEVASEVKVPKRTDNINSVPTTGREKPFPILLSKSVTVNNMLENKNYFNSAEAENQEEMSISELLQQLKALNQLKRYLDALERNYLTAREKHHNLQLQNFKDKSVNIGEFDPDRESFEAAKTCCSSTCNKILVSHQYIPSKKFAQSKCAIRNASDANILSSTLDHALQTANSLKKATERMVRAVSEDLAQVKRKQL
ncbi:protein aknad1 [Pitangus sulphuratus]|nr:protein aknad1 [Pitangus sulphuratus]